MPPKLKKSVKKKSTTPAVDPITLVIYSPPGNGKTSLAAHFPRTGFIIDSQEKGIVFLQKKRLVPSPVWVDDNYSCLINRKKITTSNVWPRLVDKVWDVVRDDSISTLVLESITGIEKILYAYHCMEEFQGDYSKEGFFSYQQGPKSAATFDLPDLIEAMTAVHESGKNVIITGHTQTKDEETPEGIAVLKYIPYCNQHTWAAFSRWASAIFFIGRKIERNVKAPGIKSKAKTDVFDRLLYLEGTPFCEAKNWLGLEGKINLGDSPIEGYKRLVSKLY